MAEELGYRVERVPVERTRALRKAVLRPYLPPGDPYVLPDDHLDTTVCFGAVTADDRVIGVARITPEAPPFGPVDGCGAGAGGSGVACGWRLRGMATLPEARGRGVGTAVLAAVITHVESCGGGILWCNARVTARGLYERAGMQAWGEVWDEPDIGPHVVMWRVVVEAAGRGC